MIIVALLGAFIFYAGLYLLWESNHVPINSMDAVMRAFNDMLLAPQTLVFTIFRGLLLVAVLYVVCDAIVSGAKRVSRRRKLEEEDKLSWKKPPPIPRLNSRRSIDTENS